MRFTKYDSSLRSGYKPHCTKENVEIVPMSPDKTPTYTLKDELEGTILAQFYQKDLIGNIYKWSYSQKKWFSWQQQVFFPDNTLSSVTNFLTGATEFEG